VLLLVGHEGLDAFEVHVLVQEANQGLGLLVRDAARPPVGDLA
jgi:hypothetical protein